jgi:HD-GYP domain-containing protein (c-di-GMP phosphodiesterase class II)
MQKVRISALRPGLIFDQSVFTPNGQKLLNAGTCLTDRHIDVLRRHGEFEVILAQSADDLVAAGIVEQVDSNALKVGQKAQTSLITKAGQVILEQGEEIEEHHLEALRAGGDAFATKPDAATDEEGKPNNLRRERIVLADALVEEVERKTRPEHLRVTPESRTDWLTPKLGGKWPTPKELSEKRNQMVEKLRQLYIHIEAGLSVPVEKFDPIIDELVAALRCHPRQFTQLALLTPRREDYLPDHAFTVTVLAMATTLQLRWPLESVREVALAGLVFDLGMLLIPERIRTGSSELTDIDRSRVRRHPIFSLAMMQTVSGVPALIQLAALQHHERENGTGYPRGVRRDNICDFARVIAAADTYAATTEPRHYRKPKLPYIAMEETLRLASTMSFWKPAVRAMVQAAGLFPVGSYVKLSNAINAHVVAANPEQLDRPTIQPLNVHGEPEGEPIDLAAVNKASLAVVRPLPGPIG